MMTIGIPRTAVITVSDLATKIAQFEGLCGRRPKYWILSWSAWRDILEQIFASFTVYHTWESYNRKTPFPGALFGIPVLMLDKSHQLYIIELI